MVRSCSSRRGLQCWRQCGAASRLLLLGHSSGRLHVLGKTPRMAKLSTAPHWQNPSAELQRGAEATLRAPLAKPPAENLGAEERAHCFAPPHPLFAIGRSDGHVPCRGV